MSSMIRMFVVLVTMMMMIIMTVSEDPLDVMEVQTPIFTADVITNEVVRELNILLREERTYMQQNTEEVKQKLQELQQKIVGVEEKVEEVEQRVAASEAALVRQLAPLATHQQIVEMKSKISTMASAASRQVREAMEDLVTVTRLEEVVADQMAEAVQECSSCALADTMAQVLATVTDNQHSVIALTSLINTTASTNTQGQRCDKAGLQETGQMTHGSGNRSNRQQVIPMDSRTPPTSTTHTGPESDPGPQSPCEDSTFVGAGETDLCGAVVRFNACNIVLLAYHCCHSCTLSRQIPEEGPWRHLTYPRTVKFLDALELMRRL